MGIVPIFAVLAVTMSLTEWWMRAKNQPKGVHRALAALAGGALGLATATLIAYVLRDGRQGLIQAHVKTPAKQQRATESSSPCSTHSA